MPGGKSTEGRLTADSLTRRQRVQKSSDQPPDFEPDGTWYSLISVGSNLYAVEPNHGEVDEITPDGIVTRLIDVSQTQGHVVPTSIARIQNGFYVSNLCTFPITPGSSARYTVNNLGGVTKGLTGVTTVVGLVVISGNLKCSTSARRGAFLCAEHVRQLGGESPLPNLMEVKG
jgi:hypothetical protein